MKIAKTQILSRKRSNPTVKFADHELTSFGGLFVFQSLFQSINLTQKFAETCRELDSKTSHFYTHGKILECIVVHLLLGFRNLRDFDYYRDDPLVKQTLRLKTLPSVPTVSRMLSNIDGDTLANHHSLNEGLVLDRLKEESLTRVTVDFDGSVQSTTRHAEGTAVGFNKKKKGARSYYPLFCTIAQTAQIFRFHHRPGNVHDSNCSLEFVRGCINEIRTALPRAIIEVRMDSAFFSDAMVDLLEELGVEYTISVPFERFVELKTMIEDRVFWFFTKGGKGKLIHYFEKKWKPKSWFKKRRFLFIATPSKVQRKGPLQLDLFEPVEEKEEYKVVVTNKKGVATNIVKYHEGRGSQEKIFGEGKDQLNMGYIPVRKRAGNEVYLLCSVMALNLTRELQMRAKPPERKTTAQRKALWIFQEVKTIRHKIIQTAGRLTRPQGELTLTLPKNKLLEQAISQLLPT